MRCSYFGSFVALAGAVWLSGCSDPQQPLPAIELVPLTFDDLPGWREVDQTPTYIAFSRSCTKLMNLTPDRAMGRDGIAGQAADWQAICDAMAAQELPAVFFETQFLPFKVIAAGDAEGLYTGYYEPLLFGSRQGDDQFTVPLRSNPSDMVTVNLEAFDPELEGRRIIGRLEGQRLQPYPDRSGIDEGAIDAVAAPFMWVDDKIAKFFLQIQGSGLVQLPDGETVRVGYAGQNGHGYRAIGRDLIEMGELSKETVSLQTIREWLLDHPDQADEVMHKNASYVFFTELTELSAASGPLGSQNVPLEPEHSLAVDRSFWPMGLPVWLELDVPFSDGERPWRQLLIAQDTGGAIKGGIRGDVFWGAGEEAEFTAGHMKSRGGMVILLPRSVVPGS